jgi:hypothetical protein
MFIYQNGKGAPYHILKITLYTNITSTNAIAITYVLLETKKQFRAFKGQ